MPGLPLLAFTRRSACLQFSRSQTSSIHCSLVGLSALRFANSDSVPPSKAIGAAPLLSSGKATQYSRFGPCASLSLHLHLVVKRTCTSQLSDMLGTQKKAGPAQRNRPEETASFLITTSSSSR